MPLGRQQANVLPFRRRKPRVMRKAWRRPDVPIIPTLFAVAGLGCVVVMLAMSPWPPDLTLRHWIAAPNCDAARLAGLAPANRGQPGYYVSHDADSDGVACEVWPQR
jgi:hypothetical protein